MRAEGWYGDPYLRHDERWFSDGLASDLVRDDGSTSKDPISEPDVWDAGDLSQGAIIGTPGDDARFDGAAPVIRSPLLAAVRPTTPASSWRYPIVCFGGAVAFVAAAGMWGLIWGSPLLLVGGMPLLWLPSTVRDLAAQRRFQQRMATRGDPNFTDQRPQHILSVSDVAAALVVCLEVAVLVYLIGHIVD